MKKISNIIISTIILISLLIPNALKVSAETTGAGDSGWISGGTIRLVEGFSNGKTGFLISLAKEDGTPIKAVFVTTVK